MWNDEGNPKEDRSSPRLEPDPSLRLSWFHEPPELLEQIVVVDGMMVPDVSKFSVAGTNKLEDDSIGSINPKTPDFMMLGMELLGPERRMERILFK